MALLQFNVDLSRVAAALERIADALERACPRPLPDIGPELKKATADNVSTLSDEDVWLRENVEEALAQAGQPPELIPRMADRIIHNLKQSDQLP